MKTCSAGKVLSRASARNCFLINQLATPGLGSLMGRRYVAGAGQLLLALLGFGLIVTWFVLLMIQVFHQASEEGGSAPSVAWIGEIGAGVFVLSWVWALVTSVSLMREATGNEPPRLDPA